MPPRTLGVEEAVRARVARDIRAYPCHTNRASELGHDCLRYLVYHRTEWEKKLLHDATLELIFREGKLHEPAIVRQLEDAGFTIVEQQRPFSYADYRITGHIDGKMLVNGVVYPLEIKTMSPHIFERVTSMDDVMAGMLEAREPWLRKYPAQLTTYMALDEKPEAVFVFKHKVTGRLVDRVVDYDAEYWAALKLRAEAVNVHCLSKTLPGRIKDERLCTECGFRHLCMPDVDFGSEADFVAELEPMLERREELKQKKANAAWLRELDEVNDQIKAMVLGRNTVIAGRWRGRGSTVKESLHKAYSYERWTWKAAAPDAS